MSEYDRIMPHGWQCPICGRVYAPDFPYCVVCGNEQTVTVAETTVSNKPQKTVEECTRMIDDLLKNKGEAYEPYLQSMMLQPPEEEQKDA